MHAELLVQAAQRHQRAVEVDGPVPSRFPQQRDQPLALAERVAADDVRALREQRHRAQEPGDLALGRRVAEDRQAEGRLRHEHVAGHRLEGRAGGVARALVVAGDHGPAPLPLQADLGRAEHVPGRRQPDADAVLRHLLAGADRLLRVARPALAHARPHDGQRLGRRQDGAVAGPGVVGMAVGDHRAFHRAHRVDGEAAGQAVQALGRDPEPGFRVRRHGRPDRSSRHRHLWPPCLEIKPDRSSHATGAAFARQARAVAQRPADLHRRRRGPGRRRRSVHCARRRASVERRAATHGRRSTGDDLARGRRTVGGLRQPGLAGFHRPRRSRRNLAAAGRSACTRTTSPAACPTTRAPSPSAAASRPSTGSATATVRGDGSWTGRGRASSPAAFAGYYVGSCTDITDMKAALEARQRSVARTGAPAVRAEPPREEQRAGDRVLSHAPGEPRHRSRRRRSRCAGPRRGSCSPP